jgi:ABC-type multidrug transport system ATPase subunit
MTISKFRFEFAAGQKVAIIGRAASGKTALLRAIHEQSRGDSLICDERVIAKSDEKAKVHQFAKSSKKEITSAALESLNLWQTRNLQISALSPSQCAAVCLLPIFVEPPKLVLIDMLLDVVDIPTRNRVIAEATNLVVTTHSPEIADQFDWIIALKSGDIVVNESKQELLERLKPETLELETREYLAARNFVDPFTIDIKTRGSRTVISAKNAKELAFKLFKNGQNDIKAIIVNEPTLADVIVDLI